MGCDIHCRTEYYIPAVGKWFDMDLYLRKLGDKDGEVSEEFSVVPVFTSRNYRLFGILAGVRYDHPDKISDPRGIPNDCCQSVIDDIEIWEGDSHSHSYYTLKELMNANVKECPSFDLLIRAIQQRYFDVVHYRHPVGLTDSALDKIRLVFWFDS